MSRRMRTRPRPRSGGGAAGGLQARDGETLWVGRLLTRHIRQKATSLTNQLDLFLNSVPILASLARSERLKLLDAFEEETFPPDTQVIHQGNPDHRRACHASTLCAALGDPEEAVRATGICLGEEGDKFYIVKDGEAEVFETHDGQKKKVNHLFTSDFFGERALLKDEVRGASVVSGKERVLVCLTLDRSTFIEVLGPLSNILEREKSPVVVKQRMEELDGKFAGVDLELADLNKLNFLGKGAFSSVYRVVHKQTGREYALKRMRMVDVMHCPEHVFCEQRITRIIQHPMIIRQYGTFKDNHFLYFLLDYAANGDLMDALMLVAGYRSYSQCTGCWLKSEKVLQGMDDQMCHFYIGSLVLCLEHLHSHHIVYRDLKPENVLVDHTGYIKLADFGFAKEIGEEGRTYTFCGTPGYVAPENILALGYNTSVDWWSLGVVTYVLLTGKQPFGTPREDPMKVLRRIIDHQWSVHYPHFLKTDAIGLIQQFLQKKPTRRLGNRSDGAAEVKRHAWFSDFNWQALISRKMTPPIEASRLMKNPAREFQLESSTQAVSKISESKAHECARIFAAF
eukprot:scaffold1969_cov417-Prasinococcus_capsulatus_cf.AAC.3